MRNAHKTVVKEPQRKRPLARPRSRWEDNIKIKLNVIECGRCELDFSGS
jgi:hypothetical protein